jgi:hypothetical protein
MPSPVVKFRIPPDDLKTLRRFARAQRRTVSAVLRDVTRECLREIRVHEQQAKRL